MYLRWQALQPSIPPHRHGTLPTAFEYEDFVIWRSNQHLRHLPPGIPGASFLNLSKILANAGAEETEENIEQLEAAGWTIAQKCKHPLHPAHPDVFAMEGAEEGEIEEPVLRCPLCVLRAHMKFMSALVENWEHLGGLWRALHHEDDP